MKPTGARFNSYYLIQGGREPGAGKQRNRAAEEKVLFPRTLDRLQRVEKDCLRGDLGAGEGNMKWQER